MKKIENHCMGCAVPGYPCRGHLCPNIRVEVCYCDECGAEITDDIYGDENEDLCWSCLLDRYRKN